MGTPQSRVAKVRRTRVPVVTERILRRMESPPGPFVARIDGTSDAVIESQIVSRLAIQYRVADLGAVTDKPIGTDRGIRCVGHRIQDFVAGVLCTGNPIVQRHRSPRLTTEHRIADLSTITIEPVSADRGIGCMGHDIQDLITRILRTSNPIAEIRPGACLAAHKRVAGFRTIAEKAVIAVQY